MDIKDFGLRLARLRSEKGVSARNMSLSIGQCAGYINSIETGKAKPSYDGIMYICEYLGVTVSEFFNMEAENPLKLKSVIGKLNKLSDRQLDIIEAMADDMIKR